MTISKEEQQIINRFVDAARRGDVAYVKVGPLRAPKSTGLTAARRPRRTCST